MILDLLFGGICSLACVVAKYRGYKGPIWPVAAVVLAFFAGIAISSILIITLTEWEPSDPPPPTWNLFEDERYRTILICGLTASLLVVVLILLLPRPAAYSGRRPTTHMPYRLIGALLGPGGVVMWFAGGSSGRMWSFLMIAIAWSCFDLSRRNKVAPGEVALSTDIRPPVLFLRSFSTDNLHVHAELNNRSRIQSWLTTDNIFHPDFWKTNSYPTLDGFLQPDVKMLLGPFIALGSPDDFLPTAGAAKIYRGHDNWREAVATLAVKAQVVVIAEGATEGLAWELSCIRNSVPPERVFIITHPREKRKSDIWEEMCRVAKKAEMILPESDPGAGTVLAFDQGWIVSPIVTGATSGIEYVSAIKKQLNAAHGTGDAKSRREQTAN